MSIDTEDILRIGAVIVVVIIAIGIVIKAVNAWLGVGIILALVGAEAIGRVKGRGRRK